MDIQAAQLRQQIEQTRTAMTAKLDLSKQYVSQRVAATVEQSIIASVHGLLETTTKSTTAAPAVSLADHCGWGTIWLSAETALNSTDQVGAESVSTGYGSSPNRATGGGARHASGL